MPSQTLVGPNPSGLCQCGCGRPAPIASRTRAGIGHVKGEPVRFLPHHHRRTTNWDRFVQAPDTDCWNWQGTTNGAGYSQFRVNGRAILVHRAYYELFVGPIPEGLVLDHLCRNTLCVNPGHLEPVTQRENVRRASPTHCPQGHEYSAENTHVCVDGSRRCRACDRMRQAERRAARRAGLAA